MYLSSVKIEITRVEEKVNVIYNDENFILLTNLNINEITSLLSKNFAIVKNKIDNQNISENDIDIITIKIILYYLSTYILWSKIYKKEKSRDLTFLEKDIQNPQTNDIIINYFIKKYPNNYIEKCSILLNKSLNDTSLYIKNRINFQNR